MLILYSGSLTGSHQLFRWILFSSDKPRRISINGVNWLQTEIEQARLRLSRNTDAKKKSQFGQFLTPEQTASFMASLFPPGEGVCRLLDAGAGIGSLSAAFLEQWLSGMLGFQQVELDAFEIDSSLHSELENTLKKYVGETFQFAIHGDDFIHAATDAISGGLFSNPLPRYSHAILNPPYKKINSNSSHRHALRRIGIETVNLYSAFVALAVSLVTPGGHIVAIIPRSFCNGPYYRPFREFILKRASIRQIHLFDSRSKAFKDDGVLQENIIVHLERDGQQGPVIVSTSTDDTFSDLSCYHHPFERIVLPDDPARFIHVPTSLEENALDQVSAVRFSLGDIGVSISTGPVVDFRMKDHLRDNPGPETVPLLYPGHFLDGRMFWPNSKIKKPNAIIRNRDTEKWLYPTGYYCVVRRFSSKEETRRVVASVVDPTALGESEMLGFENHLNVFHVGRQGLQKTLAHGLAVFLNTTAVDEAFRRFNGHTQVNATDLRLMRYPDRDVLMRLGEWALKQSTFSQNMIDTEFWKVVE
ncbi:Eco57I restriction-modification methylase domain-containing protein [Pirellulaceae bacterium SH449]